MRLGVKHANQQTVVRADFSGGLNLATTPDNIAVNQLATAINLEIDHATGRLKTVGGTRDIVHMENIAALMYDRINNTFIVAAENKQLFSYEVGTGHINAIGKLSGDLYPITASWEDGLLIATGDKLQYYRNDVLETIDSPKANSVYVRAGRVLITDDTQIRYSGVGDETNWTEDTNDASSSKFVEAGYKDGGKFIGMASLSQDVLIFKDNRRVYRLSGEYPNWVISEVSRQVECKSRFAFTDIASSVFVLGSNEVATLQTTDAYGAMKPASISALVTSEITKLPLNAKVRYISPLSQIWFIGNSGNVLVYDLAGQAWFMRRFNSPLLDVVCVDSDVYIVKRDRISVIDESTFHDAGQPMEWKFQAQRMTSLHDYFLKRTQISVMPLASDIYSGQISVGAVVIDLPIPNYLLYIKNDESRIFLNRRRISERGKAKGLYAPGERICEDMCVISDNNEPIYTRQTFIKESRNVYRSKFLSIGGFGMGGFTLNSIIMDIAEV